MAGIVKRVFSSKLFFFILVFLLIMIVSVLLSIEYDRRRTYKYLSPLLENSRDFYTNFRPIKNLKDEIEKEIEQLQNKIDKENKNMKKKDENKEGDENIDKKDENKEGDENENEGNKTKEEKLRRLKLLSKSINDLYQENEKKMIECYEILLSAQTDNSYIKNKDNLEKIKEKTDEFYKYNESSIQNNPGSMTYTYKKILEEYDKIQDSFKDIEKKNK